MKYPWHRFDVPWAEVVLDTRNEQHFTSLPDTLPAPVPDRDIVVDGWQVVPHVLRGGPVGTSISVLMLHAPDRWRGAIVMTQYSGTTFAFGQLGNRVPYLSRLLSPGTQTDETLATMSRLAAAGLPMLRKAMMDPAGWDPVGEQYADIVECDELGELNRFILNWSSSGVRSHDAAVLEDHQMRPVDVPYATRKDLRTWHEAGWTDAHEVALWLQSGCMVPRDAHYVAGFGLSAQEAFDWTETPVPPKPDPERTRAFIDAGWTPAAVRHLAARVAQDRTAWVVFYAEVASWVRAMSPVEASAYLCAGWSLDEAIAARASGDVPDRESLAFLAALQQPPRHWRLEPSQMGVYQPPGPSTTALPA